MTTILSDTEIDRVAGLQHRDPRGFARAVEQAVLAKAKCLVCDTPLSPSEDGMHDACRPVTRAEFDALRADLRTLAQALGTIADYGTATSSSEQWRTVTRPALIRIAQP